MAKFLFPTGRKSYFMAVIPLSRIQRLAVGNRGGREAYQQKERGFCLLVDGARLNAFQSWESCWLSCGRQEWGRGAEGKSFHDGLCTLEKTWNFVGMNPAGSIETIFKGYNLLMEDRITVKTTRLHPTVITKRLNHQIRPWPDLGDQGLLEAEHCTGEGLS